MVKKEKNKKQKVLKPVKKPEGFIVHKVKPKKSGFLKGFAYLVLSTGVSIALAGAGIVFYNSQVLYPSALKVAEKNTGRYALKIYQRYLNDYSTKGLEDTTGSKYLSSEHLLQNGNESRIGFIKSVLSTVKYEPLKVNKLNKYGSDYYLPKSKNKTVKDKSLVNFGEDVKVTYIDYDNIKFDEKVINDMMNEAGIKQTDSDFVDKITDLFSNYISQNIEELPTKTVERKVSLLSKGNGFTVGEEEDIFLDQLLFSSKEFHDALDRFSLLSLQGTEVESSEHKDWSSKSEEERAKFTEPYKWEKYRFIPKGFVGFYDKLKEEDQTPEDYVFPSGSGTLEDPAGLNTPVLTTVITKDDKGKEVQVPIKVTLLRVTYGSDAIKDIMTKDTRNRGIDPKSTTKYVYTKWKVENLSSKEVTVFSNSALSDKEGNISAKTGVMYGLGDFSDLKGYQYAELDDWYSSTELKEKYLVWGKDFEKRSPLIWFKALKLSEDEVKIPTDPIQTDDISANKNEEGSEEE